MLIGGDCIGGRLTCAKAPGLTQTYHRARPDYPDELFTELIETANLRPRSGLLEIGCATGKATQALASRGYRITCVELGADLAAAARHNLAGYADVTVVTGKFESWQPPAGRRFDPACAAIYDEIGEGTPEDWIFPRPGELDDHVAELTGSAALTIARRQEAQAGA